VKHEAQPEILRGITFLAKHNATVSIVGESNNKKIILELVARLFDPTHGTVLIDSMAISRYNIRSIRQIVGLVNDGHDLFSGTIFENIVYGHSANSEIELEPSLISTILHALENGTTNTLTHSYRTVITRIMWAVTEANAHHFIQTDRDLAELIGEGGKQLDDTQKQLLTVARALYKDPRILLVEEVVAEDEATDKLLKQALDRVTQNRTVLIVATRLKTLQDSDLVIFMGDKGRIIDQGPHNQLMANCPQYKAFLQANKKDNKIQMSSARPTDELTPEVTALLTKLYHTVIRDSTYSEKFHHKIEDIIPAVAPRMSSAITGDLSSMEMGSLGSKRVLGEVGRGRGEFLLTEDEDSGSM